MQSQTSISLTSGQAVTIHGWMAPCRRLDWNAHVVPRTDLNFFGLFTALSRGVTDPLSYEGQKTLDQLHKLQPDFKEWLLNKKVALVDCEAMHHRWNIDIVNDFGPGRVMVGEILQANLSARAIHGCGLNVDSLIKLGMTPDIMRLFHFNLQEWIKLGLRREHIELMTHAQVDSVFSVTKMVLEASLIR